MDYLILLEKQVKRHLTDALSHQPQILQFIEDIRRTYIAFEKEKDLLARVLKITEEEYIEINNNLNNEISNRKETIQYLKKALSSVNTSGDTVLSENLFDFSSAIVDEMRKRQKIEDTLRILINNLNIGIILKDSHDKVIYVNPVLYNIFQYHPPASDNPGEEIFTLIKGMRSRSIKKDLSHDYLVNVHGGATASAQLWNMEDGRIIEEITIPYLYGNNQRGCIYTYSDVTLKERSNEMIRKSELRNNQILKGSPNSVILVNAEGTIKFINEKTSDIFGLKPEIILNMRVHDLINLSEIVPDGFSKIEAASNEKDVLNTNFEIKTLRKDGKEIWIMFSIIKMEEMHDASYCCFSREITSRKQAEAEINNQKKFTEDILDNIPNDIAVFDLNQNYLFINRHGVNNVELRDWLIGKSDFDYCSRKGLDVSIFEKRREFFAKSVATGKDMEFTDEHQIGDGSTKYVQRKFHPHFENGEIKFVIGYGVDITKNIMNQIELEKSLDFAGKINNELEQFAYVASHDLQEPLRTISNFLSLIEQKTEHLLDDQTKRYFKFTTDAAKKMRLLIIDLLEYSKIGKIAEKSMEDIDLYELVQEIILLHDKHIEELSARITIDKLPVIRSQKSLVRQVFQNLIYNALKYHRDGIPPVINISYKDFKTHWQFSILDNGIGIDEAYFDKIFDIFQRLETGDKFTGSGIGLSISKKIIEGMNGKIWLESKKNIGTTFHFTLMKIK